MADSRHKLEAEILMLSVEHLALFDRLHDETHAAELCNAIRESRPGLDEQLATMLVLVMGEVLAGSLDDPREAAGCDAIMRVLGVVYALGILEGRK